MFRIRKKGKYCLFPVIQTPIFNLVSLIFQSYSAIQLSTI